MTPRELRTLAVQARHCDVPTIADALDAAAERIEGLEREVARLEEIMDVIADFFEGVEASQDAHHG